MANRTTNSTTPDHARKLPLGMSNAQPIFDVDLEGIEADENDFSESKVH